MSGIARTKLDDLADEFIEKMKWSEQATDHEKTLVKCNVATFASWAAKRLNL